MRSATAGFAGRSLRLLLAPTVAMLAVACEVVTVVTLYQFREAM
jgi:hypothetical protein